MTEKIVRQPSTGPSQHNFSNVPEADIERSTFDRSHGWKGTIRETGHLVPFFWDEVLPGDTFTMDTTVFMRMATPLKPIMDNIKCDIHYFFVPNRLLWDQWEIFMGEVRGPSDPKPEDLVVPQATIDYATASYDGLADVLGLPIGQQGVGFVSDLPFRCYELCFYEWYRDQNVDMRDHPSYNWTAVLDRTAETLKRRNKRKDYFTSALPWPQKGDPVLIPIAGTAPIVALGDGIPTFDVATFTDEPMGLKQGGDASGVFYETASETNPFDAASWNQPKLEADLSGATATSINDLRTAFQIQKLLERDARGGTRYIELILSHFAVQSPDYRLQRPEFIGSGSAPINMNPIASTVALENNPQGQLAAYGTGLAKAGFTHSFTEHGIVMGMISMTADLTYQQGVDRLWKRQTRYDYYWPSLSHLGEQAITGEEIYFDTTGNEDVFGYQERYAEYRYKPSRVTGQFRSNYSASLDVWHLAQDFDTRPTLSTEFLREDPPIGRVIAVPAEPHWICDAWFNYKCTRPMPVYSVPGLIDHF